MKQQKTDTEGRFVRGQTAFRNWITVDGSSGFAPESGRYHLYVSLACPWAHRTLIMRELKGLQAHVTVDVVDPLMPEAGWYFSDYPGATQDTVNGREWLHEVYDLADPEHKGRVTVPALWDKQQQTIANNESREIIRMFDHQMGGLATGPDLAPPELVAEIDAMIDANYEPVNNGVYRCGFATTQAAYAEAFDELFARLDVLEKHLQQRVYLVGDRLTEADICLFTTLVRFDPVYVGHFKCNRQRIADYYNLSAYLANLLQHPAFASTTNMRHIKEHYYRSHKSLNPTGIVPKGPQPTPTYP